MSHAKLRWPALLWWGGRSGGLPLWPVSRRLEPFSSLTLRFLTSVTAAAVAHSLGRTVAREVLHHSKGAEKGCTRWRDDIYVLELDGFACRPGEQTSGIVLSDWFTCICCPAPSVSRSSHPAQPKPGAPRA